MEAVQEACLAASMDCAAGMVVGAALREATGAWREASAGCCDDQTTVSENASLLAGESLEVSHLVRTAMELEVVAARADSCGLEVCLQA